MAKESTEELERELGSQRVNHHEGRDRNNRARARTTRISVFFVDEKDTRQPSAGQDECATTVTNQDTP